jgi:hypothetical protein
MNSQKRNTLSFAIQEQIFVAHSCDDDTDTIDNLDFHVSQTLYNI